MNRKITIGSCFSYNQKSSFQNRFKYRQNEPKLEFKISYLSNNRWRYCNNNDDCTWSTVFRNIRHVNTNDTAGKVLQIHKSSIGPLKNGNKICQIGYKTSVGPEKAPKDPHWNFNRFCISQCLREKSSLSIVLSSWQPKILTVHDQYQYEISLVNIKTALSSKIGFKIGLDRFGRTQV